MNNESKVQSPFFSATARIEVSSMKASIMHMLHERLVQDLPGAINAAVDEMMNEDYWRQQLRKEVDEAVNELMESAVKNAITYNHDMKDLLRSVVHREAFKILDKKIKDWQF